jgi:hypothetical protein
MAHQHRVAAGGVEGAIGLVDQVILGQHATALEGERVAEVGRLRHHDSDGLLFFHLSFVPETKNPAGERSLTGLPSL